MTPENAALVRQSWALVSMASLAVAGRFYDRLFEMAPDKRRLFSATDMSHQHMKFIAMLQEIVRRLDAPEHLVPQVAALGARHVQYGVVEQDYAVVGEALVWALEQELGPAMTPEVRQAWKDAYLYTAALMQRGAAVSR